MTFDPDPNLTSAPLKPPTLLNRLSYLSPRYMITSLDRTHAGFYRCIVRNRMGALLQRQTEVQVACKYSGGLGQYSCLLPLLALPAWPGQSFLVTSGRTKALRGHGSSMMSHSISL